VTARVGFVARAGVGETESRGSDSVEYHFKVALVGTMHTGGGSDMSVQPKQPDLASIKDRQQKTWTSGNFARIGNRMVIVGELLCEAVDLRAGDKVLDVATGSGNTALSAARRFCETTGIDYVPDLIGQAEERAEAEGLEVTFEVGDAEDLPYQEASFDAVLSTFGIMFAPDQEMAAGELLRVCKPGGRIGLANWAPDGFIGQLFKTIGKHVPPPPGLSPPPLWGTEDRLRELFGDRVSVEATRRAYRFVYRSADHFVGYFREYYGPTFKAFESLDARGQETLAGEIEELIRSWNKSGDETVVVPSYYLEVVARKS
jgi:ubiquinone/menaquinone biosynthesis C-methylase UbiE